MGEPSDECFRLEEVDVPELSEGQLLIKVGWLSLDPYMRGRMNDVKSYVEPLQIGDVMTGESTGVVVKSSSLISIRGIMLQCIRVGNPTLFATIMIQD